MAADPNVLMKRLGLTRSKALALAGVIDGASVIVRELSIPGAVTVQTGAFRVYNDSGLTLTIKKIRVSAGTAPTGAALIVDVKKNGTTVFPTTTKPQVAAAASTGSAVPDAKTWADGEYLTVDVTQVGSTVAGSDVVVTITAA